MNQRSRKAIGITCGQDFSGSRLSYTLTSSFKYLTDVNASNTASHRRPTLALRHINSSRQPWTPATVLLLTGQSCLTPTQVPSIVLVHARVTGSTKFWLWFTEYRYPALGTPHFQVGRFMMALFFFLLPVLIAFGDVTWFVHTVFIGSVIGKLRTVWYYVSTDKEALAQQAEMK